MAPALWPAFARQVRRRGRSGRACRCATCVRAAAVRAVAAAGAAGLRGARAAGSRASRPRRRWPRALGPGAAPRGDAARAATPPPTALTAARLLRSQGAGAAWARRTRARFERAVAALVQTAQALARAACAVRAARSARRHWEAARERCSRRRPARARSERWLARVALEWAAQAPAPRDRPPVRAAARPRGSCCRPAAPMRSCEALLTRRRTGCPAWSSMPMPRAAPLPARRRAARAWPSATASSTRRSAPPRRCSRTWQRGEAPVALIAQDRVLVRRVRALLERASRCRCVDETGWTLSTTRAAAQLMALLRAARRARGTDALFDWLKALPAWPGRSDAPRWRVRSSGLCRQRACRASTALERARARGCARGVLARRARGARARCAPARPACRDWLAAPARSARRPAAPGARCRPTRPAAQVLAALRLTTSSRRGRRWRAGGRRRRCWTLDELRGLGRRGAASRRASRRPAPAAARRRSSSRRWRARCCGRSRRSSARAPTIATSVRAPAPHPLLADAELRGARAARRAERAAARGAGLRAGRCALPHVTLPAPPCRRRRRAAGRQPAAAAAGARPGAPGPQPRAVDRPAPARALPAAAAAAAAAAARRSCCRRASRPAPSRRCATARTASSRATCCACARTTNSRPSSRSATTAPGCTRCCMRFHAAARPAPATRRAEVARLHAIAPSGAAEHAAWPTTSSCPSPPRSRAWRRATSPGCIERDAAGAQLAGRRARAPHPCPRRWPASSCTGVIDRIDRVDHGAGDRS